MPRELRARKKSSSSSLSTRPKKVTKKGKTSKVSRSADSQAVEASPPPRSKEFERTLYFYGHKNAHGYFSQWYPCEFTDPVTKTKYTSTEQYMMHGKALLFASDSQNCADMLQTDDPKQLKALGRQTENFEQAVWEAKRYAIVLAGNLLKFHQNPELRQYLNETGDKELVEAAPRDRIWGIGFGAERAPTVRERWGKNLLGKVLIEVRETLRGEEVEEKRREELKNS